MNDRDFTGAQSLAERHTRFGYRNHMVCAAHHHPTKCLIEEPCTQRNQRIRMHDEPVPVLDVDVLGADVTSETHAYHAADEEPRVRHHDVNISHFECMQHRMVLGREQMRQRIRLAQDRSARKPVHMYPLYRLLIGQVLRIVIECEDRCTEIRRVAPSSKLQDELLQPTGVRMEMIDDEQYVGLTHARPALRIDVYTKVLFLQSIA